MGDLGNGVSISGVLDDPVLKGSEAGRIRIDQEEYLRWAETSGKILYASTPHYLPEHADKSLQFWVHLSGNFQVMLGHKQLHFGGSFQDAAETFNFNAK
jgi:hypothetical protein